MSFPRLITESAGTFLFVSVIALSSPLGPFAPVAIGGALMVMVYMGGHVSGAHYNPAVSLGLFIRRVIDAKTMVTYWLVQLGAAFLAFAFAHLVTSRSAVLHPGDGVSWFSALAVEVVFTAALVLVVLNVAATKATEGNSYFGLAIGSTVAVGAFAAGPISGAAFNPAVGFAATAAGALFAHDSWLDLWLYVVGPLIGASTAAGVHFLQTTVPSVGQKSEAARGAKPDAADPALLGSQ